MMGKPQLRANFEVANFSRCRNITEEPQILWSFPAQGYAHFFVWVGLYDETWLTPAAFIFEIATFRHCSNITTEPQILGSFLAQSHVHFFFCLASPTTDI